jgi:hypothetical protein
MSTIPEIGSPDYFPAKHNPDSAPYYPANGDPGPQWKPLDDTRTVNECIDHFQAQTIVRDQPLEPLTRIVNILRNTWSRFESKVITSDQLYVELEALEEEELKSALTDEITDRALTAVITRIEEIAKSV